MLARLYSEHVDAQAAVRVENERRRKEVLAAVGPFTSALMDSVNDGVAEVFTNQRKIDAEAHELRAETQRFSKQTTKWLRSVDDFNNSLKELGDFENWSRYIENEMATVASALQNVSKGEGGAAAGAAAAGDT